MDGLIFKASSIIIFWLVFVCWLVFYSKNSLFDPTQSNMKPAADLLRKSEKQRDEANRKRKGNALAMIILVTIVFACILMLILADYGLIR